MARERPPAVVRCVSRTRRAVLTITVISAAILGIGLGVLQLFPERKPLTPDFGISWFRGVLIALVVLSYVARRLLATRSALTEPPSRACRFYTAYWIESAIGALIGPLGLAYALCAPPGPLSIVPFWVGLLVAQVLAFPKGYELDDFEQPIPEPATDVTQP